MMASCSVLLTSTVIGIEEEKKHNLSTLHVVLRIQEHTHPCTHKTKNLRLTLTLFISLIWLPASSYQQQALNYHTTSTN